mmetsp:Transcript_69097/g.162441  ORF Transcript_69097/g.162441 Transcript_69097/m.162441 type:complete len:281 (-) Transcript_69097:112-954(-)
MKYEFCRCVRVPRKTNFPQFGQKKRPSCWLHSTVCVAAPPPPPRYRRCPGNVRRSRGTVKVKRLRSSFILLYSGLFWLSSRVQFSQNKSKSKISSRFTVHRYNATSATDFAFFLSAICLRESFRKMRSSMLGSRFAIVESFCFLTPKYSLNVQHDTLHMSTLTTCFSSSLYDNAKVFLSYIRIGLSAVKTLPFSSVKIEENLVCKRTRFRCLFGSSLPRETVQKSFSVSTVTFSKPRMENVSSHHRILSIGSLLSSASSSALPSFGMRKRILRFWTAPPF